MDGGGRMEAQESRAEPYVLPLIIVPVPSAGAQEIPSQSEEAKEVICCMRLARLW